MIIVDLDLRTPIDSKKYGVAFTKINNEIFPSMIIETLNISETFNEANYYTFSGDNFLNSQLNYDQNTIEFSDNDQGNVTNSDPCEESYGQAVADCIQSEYSDYGWQSVFLWVITAFEPPVALIVAAACGIGEFPTDGECYQSL